MHRYFYQNEQMIIEKYQLQDYYEHIDTMMQNATPRRMSLIGNTSRNCEHQNIFDFGSVRDIWVYSD